MSKHTPGPWYFRPTLQGSESPEAYAVMAEKALNDDAPVAMCWGPDAEANARLMATVPELLSSCRRLVGLVERITTRPDLTTTTAEIGAIIDMAYYDMKRATGGDDDE